MNYCEVLERRQPDEVAIVELRSDGLREEHTFAELLGQSGALAGTMKAMGVGRGDVVMTVIGSRVEWVLTMLAAFRIGAIALPCVTQARAKDLSLRARMTKPALIVGCPPTAGELERARFNCPLLILPEADALAAEPPPLEQLEAGDPALIIFTSGTSGEPKAVLHGTGYLFGQTLQGEHWFDLRPGDLAWCTAAPGWSKSTRNAFITPWLLGARVLLQDARFDPAERIDVIARESVNALCMSPTEYRMVIRRAELVRLPELRSAVAAGEALDAAAIGDWRAGTGVRLRDGYGQTETGAVTAIRPDDPDRPGSMGRPLPGLRTEIVDGQLCLDPASSPTFCLGYLGGSIPGGLWQTGDLVEADEEGFLWFRGRADDVVISAGYRIDPAEVEAALASHPAIEEAAVVGAPDSERGEIVRAVVVLRQGTNPSDTLVGDLQAHVKRETAPYKYPRQIDFAEELPRTATGKLRRADLRG